MITFCVVSGNSFADAGFPVTSMVSFDTKPISDWLRKEVVEWHISTRGLTRKVRSYPTA